MIILTVDKISLVLEIFEDFLTKCCRLCRRKYNRRKSRRQSRKFQPLSSSATGIGIGRYFQSQAFVSHGTSLGQPKCLGHLGTRIQGFRSFSGTKSYRNTVPNCLKAVGPQNFTVPVPRTPSKIPWDSCPMPIPEKLPLKAFSAVQKVVVIRHTKRRNQKVMYFILRMHILKELNFI